MTRIAIFLLMAFLANGQVRWNCPVGIPRTHLSWDSEVPQWRWDDPDDPNGGANSRKASLAERVFFDPPGWKVNKTRYIGASLLAFLGQAADVQSTYDFKVAGYCEANPIFRARNEPCRPSFKRIGAFKVSFLTVTQLGKFAMVRLVDPRWQRAFDSFDTAIGIAYFGVARHNWQGVSKFRQFSGGKQ